MDGMAQASHEFVSHNYAPFNAAIAKYVEKLEQPDPRIAGQAFREKARGVGHVLRALGVAALLTLIGASLIVLCQPRNASTAPAVSNPSVPSGGPINLPKPSPTAFSGKVVIDPYLFTTIPIAENVDVVTGWKFAKSTDDKPERQFCYLNTPEELGSRKIDLAYRSQAGALVRQTSVSEFNGVMREIGGVPGEIDYETALSKCVWFAK